MVKPIWAAAAVFVAVIAVSSVVALNGIQTPDEAPTTRPVHTTPTEVLLNPNRDPEDPYIEDALPPRTDQEWLDDAREGRSPEDEPQTGEDVGDAFSFEAGVDENGVGISESTVIR